MNLPNPRRRSDILVQDLGDEEILYDPDRNEAHCLGRIAALVFNHCDGKTDIPMLARLIADDIGAPPNEDLVWYVLDQLDERQLLERNSVDDVRVPGWTRRELVQRLSAAAGIALAVVSSVPIPAAAQSVSGDKGDKGDKGDTGDKGDKGDKGDPG